LPPEPAQYLRPLTLRSCFPVSLRDNSQKAQRLRSRAHLTAKHAEHCGCGDLMKNSERNKHGANTNDAEQEARKIRRLQLMISMVMSVISQDPDLTIEEASEIAANTKRAALAMFPDKEFTYDILYKPRLQRLMNERFRLH